MKYSQLTAVTALLIVITACGGHLASSPTKQPAPKTETQAAPSPSTPSADVGVVDAGATNAAAATGTANSDTLDATTTDLIKDLNEKLSEPSMSSTRFDVLRAKLDEKRMAAALTRHAFEQGAEAFKRYDELTEMRDLASIQVPAGFVIAMTGVAGYGLSVPRAELKIDKGVKKIEAFPLPETAIAKEELAWAQKSVENQIRLQPGSNLNIKLSREFVAKALDMPLERVPELKMTVQAGNVDHAVATLYIRNQLGVKSPVEVERFAKVLRPEVTRALAVDVVMGQRQARLTEAAIRLVRDLKVEAKSAGTRRIVWGAVIFSGVMTAIDGGLTLTLSKGAFNELKTQVDRLINEALIAESELEEASATLAAEQAKLIAGE